MIHEFVTFFLIALQVGCLLLLPMIIHLKCLMN